MVVKCHKSNHNLPMQAPTPQRLVLHTATFAAWALAAAGVGYWVLQVSANGSSINLPIASSASANSSASNASDPSALARLLGALAPQAAVPVSNSNRFVLKGVVSGARGQEAALIAIDDKPAKAFRVGSALEDGLMLQSTSKGKVTLAATARGPVLMTLEMPVAGK